MIEVGFSQGGSNSCKHKVNRHKQNWLSHVFPMTQDRITNSLSKEKRTKIKKRGGYVEQSWLDQSDCRQCMEGVSMTNPGLVSFFSTLTRLENSSVGKTKWYDKKHPQNACDLMSAVYRTERCTLH